MLTRFPGVPGPFFQFLIDGPGFEWLLIYDRPKNEQILEKWQWANQTVEMFAPVKGGPNWDMVSEFCIDHLNTP